MSPAEMAKADPADASPRPESAGGAAAGRQQGGRAPGLTFTREKGVLRVVFSGDWKLGFVPRSPADGDDSGGSGSPGKAGRAGESGESGEQGEQGEARGFAAETDPCAAVASASTTGLELAADHLGMWDSSLLAVSTRLFLAATKRKIPIRDDELPEGVRNLMHLALAVPPDAGARREEEHLSLLAAIGGLVLAIPAGGRSILEFLGEIVMSFGRLFRGKSSFTMDNFWLAAQEAGIGALPIVSLISLLVGLILAFVGVIQLSMFGAQIYVSSLVAVGMTRIMGAIMTGIILAGRTGASYAAVIGTMQVNEEIDALTTLGVAPSDYLVMPRLLALTAMMPLLVLYADAMGILGGFVVGVFVLDLNPMEYYTFTQKGFWLSNLWVGVLHGAVFGLIIAVTGCYQGLRCGRSAEAVGKATTSAVVYSIVGIVLATAVLTILFNLLKI